MPSQRAQRHGTHTLQALACAAAGSAGVGGQRIREQHGAPLVCRIAAWQAGQLRLYLLKRQVFPQPFLACGEEEANSSGCERPASDAPANNSGGGGSRQGRTATCIKRARLSRSMWYYIEQLREPREKRQCGSAAARKPQPRPAPTR